MEVTDIRRWGESCREDRLLPFLLHLTSLPCLQSLHLTKVHLSRLPAAALVQAVLATPTVELDPLSNSLTTYQASLLLASLSSSSSKKVNDPKLSHLTLRNCSLTAVCPHLMASLANLSSFTALWVEFSPAQLEVMVASLANPSSKLRSLTLPDYYCAGLATRFGLFFPPKNSPTFRFSPPGHFSQRPFPLPWLPLSLSPMDAMCQISCGN